MKIVYIISMVCVVVSSNAASKEKHKVLRSSRSLFSHNIQQLLDQLGNIGEDGNSHLMMYAMRLFDSGECEVPRVTELSDALHRLIQSDFLNLHASERNIVTFSCVALNINSLHDLAPLLDMPEEEVRAMYPSYVEAVSGFMHIIRMERDSQNPYGYAGFKEGVNALLNIYDILWQNGQFSLS